MTTEEIVKARSEFNESLKKLNKEELEKKLSEIEEESKKLDEEVSKLEYTLPKAANKEKVFGHIKYFLNKQKVKWNYALGLISIYESFDNPAKTNKISFSLLDTVLRMLGGIEYEGYDEWKAVSEINEYFNPIAESYRETTNRILETADKYASVTKQLKLFEVQKSESTDEIA